MKNTTVIALVGKGGVGKTSISALTVQLLGEAKYRLMDALTEQKKE